MAKQNSKIISTSINFKKGEDPIQKIMEEYLLSPDIWYPETIKIQDAKWNMASKKREQELEWTTEEQTERKDGKQPYTKTKHNQQIMRGYSKHYPEHLMSELKSAKIIVTFKRFPVENDILESFKEIIKEMPAIDLKVVKTLKRRKVNSGIAAEIATVDAHGGKLAWERETGYRNYDLKIASEDYKYVSEKGLDYMSPYKPEIIYDIVGNDRYHIDNLQGHTTGGQHTLDVDGRLPKVHEVVFKIHVDNILKYRKIAPVKVIWVPGNHDYMASYMLCFALAQYFRTDKRVTFDLGENPKKKIVWGDLLVGWSHAIKGKYSVWVNELPQLFPKEWGNSKFREWHCGDQHKKVETRIITPVNTVGGVIIRQLTALSPVDKWHTDNLFTDAIPGGNMLLWHKEEGVFADYTLLTGQYENHRNKLVKSK